MSILKRSRSFSMIVTGFFLTVLAVSLNGCSVRNESPIEPDDETLLRTQAASTMSAIEVSIFSGMTATSQAGGDFPLTETAIIEDYITSVTRTAEAASQTETQTALWITPVPYGSPIVQLPTSWGQSVCNRAQFLGDVSYNDYSRVVPGSVIVKTWRIQNVGTCAWNNLYRIIEQNSVADVGAMTTGIVPPGSTTDITVTINVPGVEGLYSGSYLFRAADGTLFGVGSDGVTPVWFRLIAGNMQEIPSVEDRTRIQFPSGAISTSLNGRVMANGFNAYVLRALQGQTMEVSIESAGNHALLTIYGLTDGLPLVRGNASGAYSWQGVLPLTQDYALDVVSDGNPADYRLQITIR